MNLMQSLHPVTVCIRDRKPAVYAFGLATVGEQSVIPDNVKIGRNTAISGVTATEDYPGGILESGQIIKAKDGEQA